MPQLKLDEAHKQVMRCLRMAGPASRSALSSKLNVSMAVLTKLSRELLGLDLVEEVVGDEASRGRPAVPLRISASGGYAVGATLLKGALDIALVDYAGGVIAQATKKFDDPDPIEFGRAVCGYVHELAKKHRLLSSRLLGVGVAVPGPVLSTDRERWWTVEALSAWRDVPLRQVLEDELGATVWIENDGNSAVLAEFYLGELLASFSDIVAILIGHGIGVGIIADGRILMGQFGNAADIGVLYPADQPRPSTVDLFRVLRPQGCEIDSFSDFEAKTQAYRPVVDESVERAASQPLLFVDGATAWFDPGAIILSSALPESILEQLARTINASRKQKIYWPQTRDVTISKLGGSATTLGAAPLPIHAVSV